MTPSQRKIVEEAANKLEAELREIYRPVDELAKRIIERRKDDETD